jgi:hypothetical protein
VTQLKFPSIGAGLAAMLEVRATPDVARTQQVSD